MPKRKGVKKGKGKASPLEKTLHKKTARLQQLMNEYLPLDKERREIEANFHPVFSDAGPLKRIKAELKQKEKEADMLAEMNTAHPIVRRLESYYTFGTVPKGAVPVERVRPRSKLSKMSKEEVVAAAPKPVPAFLAPPFSVKSGGVRSKYKKLPPYGKKIVQRSRLLNTVLQDLKKIKNPQFDDVAGLAETITKTRALRDEALETRKQMERLEEYGREWDKMTKAAAERESALFGEGKFSDELKARVGAIVELAKMYQKASPHQIDSIREVEKDALAKLKAVGPSTFSPSRKAAKRKIVEDTVSYVTPKGDGKKLRFVKRYLKGQGMAMTGGNIKKVMDAMDAEGVVFEA